MPWRGISKMWLRWTRNSPTRGRKGCSQKYSQRVALLKEQQKHSKSGVPCREQQRKCTPKSKNTHKKMWKCKCRSFGKGTAKNEKCRSFGKGTAKTQVPFLWKRNSKNTRVVPLEKEQQKWKVQKCYSIRKGTTNRESAEVLFHLERNNKT